MRLAQGRVEVARVSIHAALAAETADRLARVGLLAAHVEIALTAGEPDEARAAANELTQIAGDFPCAWLRAVEGQALGGVLLAQGNPDGALHTLRTACRGWQEMGAHYDAARSRVLLARTYQALGDWESADRELTAARTVFRDLGAALDLRTTRQLAAASARPDGLTEREVEILRHVALGKSNREIAADLVISERTVARHLANIFAKLDLSSRTAAAAYAIDHGLTRHR